MQKQNLMTENAIKTADAILMLLNFIRFWDQIILWDRNLTDRTDATSEPIIL